MITIQLTDEQIAAIELSDSEQPYSTKKAIVTDPESAYKMVKHLGRLKREHFAVITLTSRGRVIARHIVTTGTIDATLVHPREVFRVAIKDCAAKILVVHNHPSGDATPSDDDIVATRRLQTASKIIGIPLIDHLIVGSESWYSLQEHGQI